MKRLFLASISLLIAGSSFGQTFSSEDGTSITITEMDMDATKFPNLNIAINQAFVDPIASQETYKLLSATYLDAGKIYGKLYLGLSSFALDGNYFLKSKYIDKTKKITLKSTRDGDVVTKYVAKVPVKALKSFGPHIGFQMSNTKNYLTAGYSEDYFEKWMTVAGGVSFMRTRYLKVSTDVGIKNGLTMKTFRFTTDAVYTKSSHLVAVPKDDRGDWAGIRAYLEGRAVSSLKMGLVSFHYMLGVNVLANVDNPTASAEIPPVWPSLMLGLGVGYNFNVGK